MRLTAVAAGLVRDERALATRLRELSARHPDEAEIHHLALDLADWSDHHADELEPWCAGASPSPTPVLASRPAQDADPGLQLLGDLRAVHAHARDVVMAWEIVGVAATALQDEPLQQLQRTCHEDALRQVRWLVTTLKTAAPQTLVT